VQNAKNVFSYELVCDIKPSENTFPLVLW